jgi:formylmethanofuran dehydrogenase subunit E
MQAGALDSGHVFSTLILPGYGKEVAAMIRKLKSGEYRLYSRKKDPDTGKRRNLGTFKTREAAEKHEREVQYFKRH